MVSCNRSRRARASEAGGGGGGGGVVASFAFVRIINQIVHFVDMFPVEGFTRSAVRLLIYKLMLTVMFREADEAVVSLKFCMRMTSAAFSPTR